MLIHLLLYWEWRAHMLIHLLLYGSAGLICSFICCSIGSVGLICSFICCSMGVPGSYAHTASAAMWGVLNLPLDLFSPCGLCFQPCSRRRARRGSCAKACATLCAERSDASTIAEALPIVSVDSSDASGDDCLALADRRADGTFLTVDSACTRVYT